MASHYQFIFVNDATYFYHVLILEKKINIKPLEVVEWISTFGLMFTFIFGRKKNCDRDGDSNVGTVKRDAVALSKNPSGCVFRRPFDFIK